MSEKPPPKSAPKMVLRRRPWRKAFIAAYAKFGVIARACKAAEVDRTSVWDLRHADPTFQAEMDAALEDFTDTLEETAIKLASGYGEVVFYQGKPCGVWMMDGEMVTETTPGAKLVPFQKTQYNPTVLMRMLEANRPEKFRRANIPAEEAKPIDDSAAKVEVYIPDNGRDGKDGGSGDVGAS